MRAPAHSPGECAGSAARGALYSYRSSHPRCRRRFCLPPPAEPPAHMRGFNLTGCSAGFFDFTDDLRRAAWGLMDFYVRLRGKVKY